MNFFLFFAVLFLVAIIMFIFQNPTSVIVSFLFWQTAEMSVALLILLSACAGAIVCFLFDSYRAFQMNRRIRQLQTENRKMMKEIADLKDELTAATQKDSEQSAETPTEEFLPPLQ